MYKNSFNKQYEHVLLEQKHFVYIGLSSKLHHKGGSPHNRLTILINKQLFDIIFTDEDLNHLEELS